MAKRKAATSAGGGAAGKKAAAKPKKRKPVRRKKAEASAVAIWRFDFHSPVTKTALRMFSVFCTDGEFPELLGYAVDESEAIQLAKLAHGPQVDGRKFVAERVHE